eukprot:scaffold998_cov411-Prasinococcus_capsulatus_cf.AAC.1
MAAARSADIGFLQSSRGQLALASVCGGSIPEGAVICASIQLLAGLGPLPLVTYVQLPRGWISLAPGTPPESLGRIGLGTAGCILGCAGGPHVGGAGGLPRDIIRCEVSDVNHTSQIRSSTSHQLWDLVDTSGYEFGSTGGPAVAYQVFPARVAGIIAASAQSRLGSAQWRPQVLRCNRKYFLDDT